MKRVISITILTILPLVVFLSCTRDYPLNSFYEEISFVASQEPQTRTILGEDGSVFWTPADEVSVFFGSGVDGGSKFVSQNEDPARVVELKGSIESMIGSDSGSNGDRCFWAVYPYSPFNTCDGESLTISLPSEQIAVAESFGKGCFPTIARSTNLELAFYAVCGGIEFSVSRPGIKSVSIQGNEGEALAGTVKVAFGSDGKPAILEVLDSKKEITLNAPNGSSFIPGSKYLISILPVSLPHGIKLSLYSDDNKIGTVISNKSQIVKRAIFGRIGFINDSVISWEDLPDYKEGGGTRTGLYLGIIGFNQQLYKMGLERLGAVSKNSFDAFIDGLSIKNGTLLYFSVDESIRTLLKAQYPTDLFNISLITFTDGLDQGSSMLIDNYPGDSDYLSLLNERLSNLSISGIPLTAYSVGLKGNDVTDVSLFRNNINKLASSADYAFEVSNMSLVNTRFQDIADQVNSRIVNYKYSLKVTIPGQANGTRMRFTLDGSSTATSSNAYIEGVFDLGSRTLNSVEYHGISTNCGSVVSGEVDGIFVSFSFPDITLENNEQLDLAKIKHWIYVNSAGSWQKNSEFDSENDASITVTKTKKSAVVLLNLDCSKSLGSQFSSLQSHAKAFISKLYNAIYDPDEVSGVLINKTELELYKNDSFQLTADVLPASALNHAVQWSTDNPLIATVSSTGLVTGLRGGACVITVRSVEGDYSASCTVRVREEDNPGDPVDLGLSVKWASHNLGAVKPEETGLFYAWGETETKTYFDWSNYKWCNGSSNTLTKYNSQSSNGVVDGKRTLDLEDDAAHIEWHGSWRIPSVDEFKELFNSANCSWTWTSINGVNGYLVCSKLNGYTNNSIFLPVSGFWNQGQYSSFESRGFYGTSSLYYSDSSVSWQLDFYPEKVQYYCVSRASGHCLRPVCDK